MTSVIEYRELTEKVIGCFFAVHNELGGGFLESVYENALMIEFGRAGLNAENQKKLDVYYKNQLVGDFRADIIVEEKILLEIKAVNKISDQHDAQLLNYLKATGIKVDFIVNFGRSVTYKRKIF